MGRREYTPSLWDRLFDPYGELRAETLYDLATYRQSVARDLQMLLNTTFENSDAIREMGYPQAARSALCFGHPGLPDLWVSKREVIGSLQTWYGALIETHEPRLRNVRVQVETAVAKPPADQSDPAVSQWSLRMRIVADLWIAPRHDVDVEFNAEFETVDLRHTVTSTQ